MNLRCKVCGEKAAGFHFGAFTCEGCKSFFGRCCNNMSVIGECRNNKECIIDKKNRTSCKACRLQKCLLVGMSKSGSRYGRRSNWFKQYFQENELRSKRIAVAAATSSSPASRSVDSEKCDRLSTSDEELEPELESKLSAAPYSPFSAPLRYPSMAKDTIAAVTAAAAAAASAFSDLPQTPVSSHLYLNCFPHLSLNQLVAYRHDSAKLLGPNSVPLTVLPNDHIHRYWDKLFEAQVHRPELAAESEDPLDLSAGKQKEESSADYGATKRSTPLDLSVK